MNRRLFLLDPPLLHFTVPERIRGGDEVYVIVAPDVERYFAKIIDGFDLQDELSVRLLDEEQITKRLANLTINAIRTGEYSVDPDMKKGGVSVERLHERRN